MEETGKSYKHLDTVTALFVAVLLISNLASTKICDFHFFQLDGGTIVFPLSYIFGDILTEVYGYKRSRKVIWLGFSCAFLMSACLMIVGSLPCSPDWHNQDAYDKILGSTPRIVAASLAAYFSGEFTNSYVLAKMKLLTHGRWLWTRTIGSTVAGELVDSMIFVLAAFFGLFPASLIVNLIISNYLVKTAVEILFTPITYRAVRFLKKAESEDYYDYGTNFNPFVVK